MNNIAQIINVFLTFDVQLKINHWQTKSYGRHKAFEETYNDFYESLDKFVECYIGKYGRFKLDDDSKTITLFNINEMDLNSMCTTIREFLVDLSNNINENDRDLLTIVDDMITITNKLRYLLTLK